MTAEYDKQLIFLLLRSIKFGIGIDYITELGYSYETISHELSRCFDLVCVIEVNGKIELTEKGERELRNISVALKKHKTGWIDPEYRSKIDQIDKFFLFLPKSIDEFR